MTMEDGRLSQDVGPFTVEGGMNASTPEAQIPPNQPESLFNIDVTRDGNAGPRPGSVFQARLGAGPILGLAEHVFEFGSHERRLVAMVADAYGSVNLLDPASDGVGTGGAAFCPDVLKHGQVLFPILAADDDSFVFQSFLNKLYFGGSSITSAIFEYDYSTNTLAEIRGVKGRCVAAQGNRIFVGGDPTTPNLVFPSDPDDPTTFNLSLGFQVGNRTDGIVRIVDHEGMLVVFGNRSASWVLIGVIETGDIQVETFSEFGIVGPQAVAQSSDGFLYYIAPNEGMVRWRRGLDSPDVSFAQDALKIFRSLETQISDMSGAVVSWDAAAQAVRFEIPEANVLLSYFPRRDQWSFGASTMDEGALEIREYDATSGPVGEDRYTALASYRDPLDGNDKLYGGDLLGHVWAWKRLCRDKTRTTLPAHEGTPFISIIRWGNTEIAPVGYRAVIESLLLDFRGGYNYEFTVSADMDYAGFFSVAVTSGQVDGALLPLPVGSQDESRVLSVRLHPQHVRVRRWDRMIGKVVRLEMAWVGSRFDMAFVGMELERSLEPQSRHAIQSIPVPPAVGPITIEELGGPIDGGGTTSGDGTTTEPHDPPRPEIVLVPNLFPAGGPAARAISFVSVDTNPPDALAGDNLTELQVKTDADVSPENQVYHSICSRDGNSMWTVGGISGQWIVHWDLSGGASPAAYDWAYDVSADALASLGFTFFAGNHNLEPFYSDTTDRLYIWFSNAYGTGSGGVYLLVYDVSVRTVAPVLIAAFGPLASQTGAWRVQGVEMDENDEYFWVGNSKENVPASGQYVAWVQAFRLAPNLSSLTPMGAIKPFPSQIPQTVSSAQRMSGMTLRRGKKGFLLASLYNQPYVAAIDISDPGAPVFDDELGLFAAAQPRGITFNPDGTRAYVLSRADPGNTNGCFLVIDTSDTTALSLLHTELGSIGIVNYYEGIQYVRHETEPYLLVVSYGQIASYDVSNDVAPALVSSAAINPNIWTFGAPGGARTIQNPADGDPVPVAANVAMAVGVNGSRKGVVVVIGLDDYANPTVDAFVQETDLWQRHGPYVGFAPNGDSVAMFSRETGLLQVWSLGGSFGLVYEGVHPALLGAGGLIPGQGTEVWAYRYDRNVISIDLADPSTPVLTVTSVEDTGLPAPDSLYTEMEARQASSLVFSNEWQGSGLVTTAPARASELIPAELWRPRVTVADAVYGYFYNEFSSAGGASLLRGGVCVVDLTQDSLPIVGYEHWGDVPHGLQNGMKHGNYVYLWGRSLLTIVDVSVPANPTRVASYDVGWFIESVHGNGANEVVVFGRYAATGKVKRLDVTAPAAPILIEETTVGAGSTSGVGGMVNGKVVVTVGSTLYVLTTGPLTVAGSVAIPDVGEIGGFGFQVGGSDYFAFLVYDGPGGLYFPIHKVAVYDVTVAAAPVQVGLTSRLARNREFHLDPATAMGVITRFPHDSVSGGITMVDLTTPAAPSIPAPNHTDGLMARHPLAAKVVGSTVVYGSDLRGLAVYDASAPALPVPIRWINDNWIQSLRRVHPIRGGTSAVAVATRPTGRIYAVDLTQETPRASNGGYTEIYAAGSWSVGLNATALSDDGTRLFVGWAEAGMWKVSCYDVTDPAAAVELGAIQFTINEVRAIRVSGTSLQIGVVTGNIRSVPRLWMVDFTVESAPVILGSVKLYDTSALAFSQLEMF